MILRKIFANAGKPASPSRLMRVVATPQGYMPFQQWKEAELAKQARIAQSQKEEYDLTYRTPLSSTKAMGYDFSQ
jgi:hypothetical protein